jgi:predicted O-methyltransferase YrrM
MMDAEWFESLARKAQQMKVWPWDGFPPSLYYRFLAALAGELRPSLSVELGVCGGGGSFHLAVGHPEGRVVGVEKSRPDAHMAANWEYMQKLCRNFTLWKGDSVADAPEIAKAHGQPGIVFFDTTHTFGQTVAELDAWLPFLADRCVLCFDDLFREEMHGFWEWLDWPKHRMDFLHDGAYIDQETGFGGGGFGIAWRS